MRESNNDHEAIKAITVHSGQKVGSGEVQLAEISLGFRIAKTLFVALIWAFITFLNLLTPLLHLVTGPLSVIAGIYFSVRTYRGRKIISSGKATCPVCNERFETMTGKYTFPVSDTCTHCGREVELRLRRGDRESG